MEWYSGGTIAVFQAFAKVIQETNVLPKLAMLRQFGFYPEASVNKTISEANKESCGAHSPG